MSVIQGRGATLTIGSGENIHVESISITSPFTVGLASTRSIDYWHGDCCVSFPMSRSKAKRIGFKLHHHFCPRRRKLRASKQS